MTDTISGSSTPIHPASSPLASTPTSSSGTARPDTTSSGTARPGTTRPATAVSGPARGRRGEGTQRERRPGVWEIRIPVAPDPATGRRRQISLSVAGTAADATARRIQLLAWHRDHGAGASDLGGDLLPPPSRVTVGQLLEVWLVADHTWKPSTYVGYRSTVRALAADAIADCRAQALTPQQVRHRLRAWEDDGASLAVRGGRFRALRACLSWAYNERLIDNHPVRLMRGPGRTQPRRPLAQDELHALLLTAELRLLEAHANHQASRPGAGGARGLDGVHRAEQDLLLVRLAADTGARRGELTALRFSDLTVSAGAAASAPGARNAARTLHIERAISAGQLTTPKSGHGRTLTLGADTAALWHRLHATWVERHLRQHDANEQRRDPPAGMTPHGAADLGPAGLGPWVFTSDLAHQRRVGSEVLGHRFERIRDAAGVPDATLHRLRHTVATHLVSNGQILQAQARLGHADAATTLREYSHALPAGDAETADAINDHLDLTRTTRSEPDPSMPN